MSRVTDQVKRQFGPVAEAYAKSSFHAHGPDLIRLVAEAGFDGHEFVVDLGCGAGHTAVACALHAARVVGIDVTPQMVEMAVSVANQRGVDNVSFRVADVAALPFDDESCDVVTSRVSAHHYADLAQALAEAYRVLKPGGLILISDSISPEPAELDTFLNCIELLRDPSHVRNYRISEWTRLLAGAGFEPAVLEHFSLDLDGAEWVKRIRTPRPKIMMLKTLFAEANSTICDAFQIRDTPWGYTLPLALLRGRKGVHQNS